MFFCVCCSSWREHNYGPLYVVNEELLESQSTPSPSPSRHPPPPPHTHTHTLLRSRELWPVTGTINISHHYNRLASTTVLSAVTKQGFFRSYIDMGCKISTQLHRRSDTHSRRSFRCWLVSIWQTCSFSETLQGRVEIFIIRNVTRDTFRFVIRKVTRESRNVHHQKRYKGYIQVRHQKQGRQVHHQKGYKGDSHVHHQEGYKGEWKCSSSETLQGRPSGSSSEMFQGRVEGGITQRSNFTPLGQVPRHSPLVPPTVSTLHLSLDTVHSSLLRCPLSICP